MFPLCSSSDHMNHTRLLTGILNNKGRFPLQICVGVFGVVWAVSPAEGC